MSFERSYNIESHERIKQILIFANKSLLLPWWVTYVYFIQCHLTWSIHVDFYVDRSWNWVALHHQHLHRNLLRNFLKVS